MKRLLSVEASAGSGKTFRLANRYIALLGMSETANILAITFTNKASAEMKSRILHFLEGLGGDENVVRMVCEELGVPKEELLARKAALVEKFLRGDVHIQTIDSFLNEILRKFALYAGVRSDFAVGSIDGSVVFERFLEELSEKDFSDLLEFAKEEEKFIGLKKLFEDLYEKDKEFANIHVHQLQRPDEKEARAAFERLKRYILESSLASCRAKDVVNVDFYDIPSKGWFKKEELKTYQYFKKKGLYQPWFEDVLQTLHAFFRDYFLYRESQFLQRLFAFYNDYKAVRQSLQSAENTLSFKEIEHRVFELLRGDIASDFLYFRLDSRIDHILIDEFQDTSVTQWKIFEPLVEEIAAGVGRKEERSFFYVGDTKQAIYRFRGGMAELFEYATKKFGMEREALDTNYRSARNIVEFVNEKFGLQEKANSQEAGYVEVVETSQEEAMERIYEAIVHLNEAGVADKDIAILVHTRDEILDIGDFLKERGKKVVTADNAKVIHQPSARAVIALMQYLYDPGQKIELLNFLSLIGKKYDASFAFKPKSERPFLMVKEIMEQFDLMNAATLKLLEFAKGCETLVDFCATIESFDAQIPAKQQEGIHITTIHKSKGLEYGHVIVVDRLKKENSDKSNIIFEYEGIELKGLKLKLKDRELVDPEYAKLLEKIEEQKRQDKKNLEYVAFTRAKNSLIILKKTKESSFKTPLEPMKRGSIIPSKTETSHKLSSVEVQMRNFGKQSKEDMVQEEEFKPNDYDAIYLGDAIHYALECEDIEAVRNHFGAYCDMQEVIEAYERAKKSMKKGLKELPYIYNDKVGRIDLFIVDENCIIDYKLTKPHDKRQYFAQVRGYIEAVEALTKRKARGFLYYMDKDEFEEVDAKF